MEKKKLHGYTRIDENKVISHQIFGPNKKKRCIAQASDFNLKNVVSQQNDINELNDVTSTKSEGRTDNTSKEIIDSDIILPSEGSNKDSNFEYEEEWDIGGIPELLNELDADIEKSLTVDLQILPSKFDCGENFIKEDIVKLSTTTSNEKINISERNARTSGNKADLESSEKLILHTSTFAGFSKDGHLISTTSPPSYPFFTSVTSALRIYSDPHLRGKVRPGSMSSQAGNSNSAGVNVGSGGVSNISNNQSGSASNNSTKSNTKMSIDHQATLDKGLKMKIKRTKPGTKSSEAKHEIVKATEQQLNGMTGGAVAGCNNNPDDNTNAISSFNPISQSSQNNVGNSSAHNNTVAGGSKKNGANNANQMNSSLSSTSNSCNNSLNSGVPTSNNPPQSTSLGTKRTSSGHRRDKIKDKSSHSNRTVNEKSPIQNNDKELQEKSLCNCSVGDNTLSTCSSNMCIRRNECTVTQRLSSSSGTAVPPGVFIPSSDTSTTNISATNLLSVSTTISSSPVVTNSSTISGAANTPGPPNRDISSGGNIKISSHIAAQLAAAAASNCTSGSSALINADIKTNSGNTSDQIAKPMAPGIISATVHHSISIPVPTNKSNVLSTSANSSTAPATVNAINQLVDDSLKSPPAKRAKHNDCKMSVTNSVNKEMVDICIGTSVGTITEPDCLGPCEPGTSVTLEGIVWHETEGGVLVVNVTWRGKTYVGTLLDCTRHDWAPPRFCDSPSDELDSRTPKGRGKRGRAVTTPDLSNFTETRSSIYFSHPHVHSKLRNGTTKGGRGNSRTSNTAEKNNGGSSVSSGNGGSTPSTSPTAFLPPRTEKRKSKDEPASPTNVDNDSSNSGMVNASGIPISAAGGGVVLQPQSLINPVTGLNVQISAKKCKTSSPCAISPVLLECPEHDCSKKYKHANGLRYHQSHAHGNITILDDDSMADVDEPHITPLHSPIPLVPTPGITETMDNSQSLTVPQLTASKLSDSSELCSKFSDADAASSPLLQSESSAETADTDLTSSATSTGLLHTVSTQSNSAKTPPSSTISSGKHTPGEHIEASNNDKINVNSLLPLEENTENTIEQSPSEKTGVLRFGQADTKIGNVSLLGEQIEAKSNQKQQDSILSQSNSVSEPLNSRSIPTQICKDSNKLHQQVLNSDSLNINTETSTQNSHNVESIQVSNKTSASSAGKQKRNRKSPAPTEFDVDGFNTCNAPSREDVQSPAYSDISDDSTPVNDQLLLEKPHLLKNSDIIKKSPDMILSSGSGCPPSVQSTMPSPLGGYGVYQFYQQQQFLVQPPVEPQQSTKNSLTTNNIQSTIPVSCTPQQSPNHTELNRKEPALDLITKPTTSTLQISSPTQQDINKDGTQNQTNIASNQSTSGLSMGSGALSSSIPSKSVSHYYAFNYMSPNYTFNVDQNYVPVPIATEDVKGNRHTGVPSPTEQQQSSVLFKDDRAKELNSPNETMKVLHQQQITSNKPIKSEPIPKAENLKTDSVNTTTSIQMSHLPLHKDLQGLGTYSNMYQRHPITLTSQQLSREEELRRYYIFSDQQRRQNSTVSNINLISQQPSHQQSKDESAAVQGNPQTQQQIKIKSNASLSMLSSGIKNTTGAKEAPKQKQEDEIKVIKQEGQKPTMETQGPPPPPTSQYFLHPSYIAPTPFGFDPNHPMYRNVLMSPTSPYNAAPYHLPIPRYHAPEDLSRNTGTKALDVLHHAASQYYTTHKIHELSERALKSPNSSSSNTVKVSVSSPTIGSTQHSNISANLVGHHSSVTQPPNSTQLSHNLGSQSMVPTVNKGDITGTKSHGNGSSSSGVAHNETQKSQASNNSTAASNNSVTSANSGGGTDSRSPPPQRHVHTHHHTHVGLGYPMYPAPYGAAVLASQQAAAVAVINPFPPGPTK